MQIKKRRAAIALLAACSLVACGSGDAGEDTTEDAGSESSPVTLDFGYLFAADHHLRVNVLDPWSKELTEATDGTLKFNIQPGGTLADAATSYDYVAGGSLDASWSLQSYTPGRFPLTEFVDLPFQFDSSEQAVSVFWDLYEEFPELQKEYEDVKLLAVAASDIGEIFTAKKQISKPEDLKGQVIRTPSPKLNQAIDLLGGSPVDMPGPEVFDALDRGLVDGYMIARTGPRVLDLTDNTKYATSLNAFTGPQYWVMSKKAYDALSEDQRAAIDETAGRELSLRLAREFDSQGATAEQEYKKGGVTVTEFSDSDRQVFIDKVQPVIQTWIKDREKDGLPGEEMFAKLQELTKKYS
jgi:TRAP-type C4-dicarboxylate transport system substrate-binding protein